MSQIFTVLSAPPDAKYLPSEDIEIDKTAPLWPMEEDEEEDDDDEEEEEEDDDEEEEEFGLDLFFVAKLFSLFELKNVHFWPVSTSQLTISPFLQPT